MNPGQNKLTKKKISNEFASRLDQLAPWQTVRAVILLRGKDSNPSPAGRRQSRDQRKAAIDSMRQLTLGALKDIDDILKGIGGHRLENQTGVLGSIIVETTRAGIDALAESAKVNAILEDQPLAHVVQPHKKLQMGIP